MISYFLGDVLVNVDVIVDVVVDGEVDVEMDIVVDVLGDVLVDVDPAKGQYGVIAGYLSIGNQVNVLAPRSRTENKGPVAQTSTTGVFLSQAIPHCGF